MNSPDLVRRVAVSLALCTALLASACGGGGHPEDKARTQSFVTILDEIVTAGASAGGDCEKMATAIEAVYVKHEAEMRGMKPWLKDVKADKERAAKLAEALLPRLKTLRPQFDAVLACKDHPAAKAVQARLKELMQGG